MMKRYSLEMVVVLVLFLFYTLCAITVCIIGTSMYKSMADSMSENYNSRTSILYITEKIRQNDQSDSIRIEEVDGNDAIVFTERESGEGFEVWLFVKDGVMYEGLFEPGTEVTVEACQKVMPMQDMEISTVSAERQSLKIRFVTAQGTVQEVGLWSRANDLGGV